MQINDSDVIGWLGAVAAALVGAMAWFGKVFWGAIKTLFNNEAACQKRLARLEGVMALQAKYERRGELRDAMVDVVKGSPETDKLLDKMTSGRRAPKA